MYWNFELKVSINSFWKLILYKDLLTIKSHNSKKSSKQMMLEMYKNIYYSIKHKFYTNPLPLEFSSIFATNFLSNRIHINLINDIPTYICRNMDPGWNVPRAEWWLTQSVRGHWTSHANQVSVTWVSASTASKRRRTTTGCIVVPRRASARTAVSRSNRSWASPRRRSSRWAAAGARPLITTRRPVSIPKESGRTVSWAFTLPSSFHHHGSWSCREKAASRAAWGSRRGKRSRARAGGSRRRKIRRRSRTRRGCGWWSRYPRRLWSRCWFSLTRNLAVIRAPSCCRSFSGCWIRDRCSIWRRADRKWGEFTWRGYVQLEHAGEYSEICSLNWIL